MSTFNYHLIINERERDDIVNALSFFEAFFDKNNNRREVIEAWQDVANDSWLPGFDQLATKVATLN